MNFPLLPALLLIAAVAAISWWLRSAREEAGSGGLPDARGFGAAPAPDADEGSEAADDEAAVITVDGLAFIEEEHGVRLVSTPEPWGSWQEPVKARELLRPGDFAAARIARGAAGHDPWRLELLGHDGEYVSFGFDDEDAARCALGLIERRGVLRYVLDEAGRPLKPSAEQFTEARRRRDETERELALGLDEYEGGIER